MKNPLFEKALNDVPNYIDLFARNSINIIDEIHLALEFKGWTQKELAKSLNKSESEISKWLSGGHNLTLKTISKLEDVLDAKLITTISKLDSYYVENLEFCPNIWGQENGGSKWNKGIEQYCSLPLDPMPYNLNGDVDLDEGSININNMEEYLAA